MGSSTYSLVIALLMFFVGCKEQSIRGGQITIRNDILDKEYNTFIFSDLVTDKGITQYSHKFHPGEELALPFKNIREFQVQRQYDDHTKVYKVKCPDDFSSKVTIKLIDIHTNRLSGGCVLVKRGVKKAGGYVKWE